MQIENRPMKAILDLSCICRRALEREMVDLGLSSVQSRMLCYLYFQSRHGKSVFQKELEEEFKIRKSSVTSVLQILEKKGLVERIGVPGDARRKELILTEQGISVQERVMRHLENLENRVNQSMSPEEEEIFLTCIRKIETRLKEAEYDKKINRVYRGI